MNWDVPLSGADVKRLRASAKDCGVDPAEFIACAVRGELDRYDFERWYSRHGIGRGAYGPVGRDLSPEEEESIPKMVRQSVHAASTGEVLR